MTSTTSRRKRLALALLCTVQFMVVLDVAIVNVALPSIQSDLGFSQQNLQWVISAYALLFGGFLLLGGRAADLLGRRRMFRVGLIVFSVASLLSGLAWSDGALIASRALQGLGSAIISPAALSILTTTFHEPSERNTALGAWGAVGAFGAVAGVLLGGVLTDLLSWEWIFYVNVPVGIGAFAIAPRLLGDGRDAHARGFDLPGAGLVTSGLVMLFYTLTQANAHGWGSATTIGLFGVAAVLLCAFVAWERRTSDPLVPASLFRLRTLVGANVAGVILGTIIFSMFLMLTLYMQQVLGYSPLRTGVAYLAVAGTAIVWSAVAAKLVTRVGVKPVLVAGMAFLTAGLAYFSQVSADGSYVGDLLPGLLLVAIGMGFSFVPISIAALAGVAPSEAGVASGLINTSQQIGGALGIAALSAIATSTTAADVAGGSAQALALTDGFHAAFVVGAAAAVAGLVVAVGIVRGRDLARPAAPVQPVLEAA
jgi:EmrB/QacA subfamily drug resistance transporter